MSEKDTQSYTRRLLRCIPVLALTGLVAGCASPDLSIPLLHKAQSPAHHAVRHSAHHKVARHVVGRAHSSKAARHTGHRISPQVRLRRQYGAQLAPILDTSTRTFDKASSAVSTSPDLSQLVPLCTNYGNQITMLMARADGIPHPYAWYTPVGTLHHRVMGAYHYMLGALEECQTAGDTQDSAEAAGAISDVATAASRLHQIDSRTHALAAGH